MTVGAMTVAPQQVCAPGGRRSGWARWWPGIRLLGGALVLAVVLWQLGAGPFLVGIRSLDVPAVLAALLIGVVTTVCSAWRWRVVAVGSASACGCGPAVAAYYGSQFLNATLPGGVLGDVHRAVRHGRTVRRRGAGLRSVASANGRPGPVHACRPDPAGAARPARAAAALAAGPARRGRGVAGRRGRIGAVRGRGGTAPAMRSRLAGTAVADLRSGAAGPVRLAADPYRLNDCRDRSRLTFVVAARIIGVPASPRNWSRSPWSCSPRCCVPVNVGGWGPRESVAAGLFAAAGWGAAAGVAAATAFGLLALIATLPGLVVLVARPLARSLTRPSGASTRAARDG